MFRLLVHLALINDFYLMQYLEDIIFMKVYWYAEVSSTATFLRSLKEVIWKKKHILFFISGITKYQIEKFQNEDDISYTLNFGTIFNFWYVFLYKTNVFKTPNSCLKACFYFNTILSVFTRSLCKVRRKS